MTEQEEIIECLQALELREGSHENLSAICAAIYEPMGGWTIGACQVLRDTLVNLLSETDEEALREAYTKGREDGMGVANKADMRAEYLRGKNDGYDEGWDAGFASADDWLGQHEDAMAEHGWVRLPKDADGESIHMGDLVTVPWKDKVYEVAGFSCTKQLCSGIRTIWIDVYSPEKQRNVPLCGADSCRHYHAPTVEDVLHELIGKVLMLSEIDEENELVAEYAKRLTLRGDDE